MTVDSYRNFKLRVKYIGVARILELQGIHSFLILQIELVRIFVYNHCSVAAAVLLLTGSEMSTLTGSEMSTLTGSEMSMLAG